MGIPDYVIETSQYPAPLGGEYADLKDYNEKYRGAMIFHKFNREKRRIMPEELSSFNECFIVGSAAEVTPVAEIGPYSFKPGNISRTMMDAYTNAVRPKSKAA